MEYEPYQSIKSFHQKNLGPFRRKNVILTEKIHGSNWQFWIILNKDNTINIKGGKRSAFIENGDKFFNSDKLTLDYKDRLETLILNESSDLCETNIIRLIGEYYGGNYHGEKDSNSISIQKGAFANYSTKNDFIIFDIVINGRWLKWDDIKVICNKYYLNHVPEVCRGIWEDIYSNFNIDTFESILSKQINNDSLKNIAEGVVIRLEEPDYEMNSRDYRVKWKCNLMLETSTQSYKCDNKYDKYISHMNQNRFDSYLSKVGPDEICFENIGVNIKSIIEDIFTDIKPPKTDIKNIRKVLGSIVRNYIIEFIQSK